MDKTLSGRPPLNIPLQRIIQEVRRGGGVTAGAKSLGCSPGYIHKRLRMAQMGLRQVLEATDSTERT